MKRTMKRIAVCVLVLGVLAFAGAAAAGENARDSIARGSLERSLPQPGAQEMTVRTAAGSYGTLAHDSGDRYHRGDDHGDHNDHDDHGGHNGGGGGC